MTATHLIPITVLTGFLGSGKTTVLNGLLRHPQLANTAVIVNEFGEIGLDHLLVTSSEENVVLLDAGCLCCTINNSLRETLSHLWLGRVRNELPAFDRVVVETTGLAEPGPIMQAITRDPVVSDHYRLDGTVACVDAVHAIQQLKRQPEVAQQVAVADRLILTKTDLVSPATADAIEARLSELNPGVSILRRTRGEVAPVDVLGVGLIDDETGEMNTRRWLHQATHSTHAHHEAHRHSENIKAHCFRIRHAVSWAGLAAWCDLMAETHGDALLRVKGIIHIAETDQPVVVHGVHRLFDAPIRLQRWPDDDHTSRLVIIGRELESEYLLATLNVLQLPPGSGRPSNLSEVVSQPRATPSQRALKEETSS